MVLYRFLLNGSNDFGTNFPFIDLFVLPKLQ